MERGAASMIEVEGTEPAGGVNERHVEVLIVGAGLSGIGVAARLERDRPGTTYAVLDMREAIGGTWDLFRYPGVRSDTDMYTFSYPFRPWSGEKSMGDGEDIRAYIRDTAAEHDVERHIEFGTRVRSASWCSAEAQWTVHAEVDASSTTWTCSFLYLCTGYYDYERGHQPDFEGLEDYRGVFVNPQFWPEDLDYAGKKVVVIGSGATAITLIPAMTDDAEHVTMLQRSPSYVATLPEVDTLADVLRRWLPAGLAHRILRAKNVLLTQGIYTFSQRLPRQARALLRRAALKRLKDPEYVDTHFRPSYEPWDQRLTLAPDGDLFQVIHDRKASVVTDHIDRFVPEGIRLGSGEVLEADIVVSATGLSLKPFGGIELEVDGESIHPSETVAHRAVLLTGVPNLAFTFGYINTSWTLRADLSARYVVRLLKHMDRHGYVSATPVVDAGQERRPFITDLNAGYIKRGIDQFPAQGERDPWLVRQNYVLDSVTALPGDVSRGLRFSRRSSAARAKNDTARPAAVLER
jgi:monooxygenase